ncbi:DUF1905 domain-containing protein [Nocardioides sp. LML1-1-1.1]|uniref:DUF1905 domain-containing protein n=1 Tax=Nocardioides sp. LML1-1-1.1 TaxID=3135248 RepID=UPI00342FFA2F
MELTFTGPVVEWRGPAPYWFLAVPVEDSEDLKEAARGLEYWGQVAVEVRIGDTDFTTALFPKDGRYLVPLKVAARRAAGLEDVEAGQELTAWLRLAGRPGLAPPG